MVPVLQGVLERLQAVAQSLGHFAGSIKQDLCLLYSVRDTMHTTARPAEQIVETEPRHQRCLAVAATDLEQAVRHAALAVVGVAPTVQIAQRPLLPGHQPKRLAGVVADERERAEKLFHARRFVAIEINFRAIEIGEKSFCCRVNPFSCGAAPVRDAGRVLSGYFEHLCLPCRRHLYAPKIGKVTPPTPHM